MQENPMLELYTADCSVSFLADLLHLSKSRLRQLAQRGIIIRERHGHYHWPQSVAGYVRYLRTLPPRHRRRPASPFVTLKNGERILYFYAK
jgi:hypothetical protein